MSIKPRFYALAVLSLGVFLSANVSADIVISDNFDGTAGTGPALQVIANGAQGGGGSFDNSTGLVIAGMTDGSTSATGFNNTDLVDVSSEVVAIKADFQIDSVENLLFSRSNGFFLGLVTNNDFSATAGATDPTGDGLYNNNNVDAVGLLINSATSTTSAIDEARIVSDGASLNTTLASLTLPESADELEDFAAAVEDGFTFSITLNADETIDVSTTGLLADINETGLALTGDVSFADFVANGVGVNATFQGGGGQFTAGSVSVHLEAIPEPSSLALLGLTTLGLVARRRR